MLERVKHLFNVPGVVFVIATDTEQLCHSVGAVYGQDIDARGYLLRFFDRTYHLAEPSPNKLVAYRLSQTTISVAKLSAPGQFREKPDHFIGAVFDDADLTPREIERCIDLLQDFVSLWEHDCKIQLLYLLPLIIAECRADTEFSRYLSNIKGHRGDLARPAKKWNGSLFVIFPAVRGSRIDETPTLERIPVLEFLMSYMGVPRERIDQLDQVPGRARSDVWLIEQFLSELTARSPRRHGEAVYSYSHEYSTRVRSVGQFGAAESDTK